MAAGKNYLKTNLTPMPGEIPMYFNATGTSVTLSPPSGGNAAFCTRIPVLKDGGGFFIMAPLNPASIPGLAALVQ